MISLREDISAIHASHRIISEYVMTASLNKTTKTITIEQDFLITTLIFIVAVVDPINKNCSIVINIMDNAKKLTRKANKQSLKISSISSNTIARCWRSSFISIEENKIIVNIKM